MSNSFNSLLVPVDFSNPSREAFSRALNLLGGDSPAMIVLHVIDQAMLDLMSDSDLGSDEELKGKLRKRRESDLQEFTNQATSAIDIKGVVSIGIPFLEIIRKSEDFAVDAIVMGKVGVGDGFEKLLFGSTAERVLRGSLCPVLVYPCSNKKD